MCTHVRPSPPSTVVPFTPPTDTDNQIRLADFGFAKMIEEGEDGLTGLCGTKVGSFTVAMTIVKWTVCV